MLMIMLMLMLASILLIQLYKHLMPGFTARHQCFFNTLVSRLILQNLYCVYVLSYRDQSFKTRQAREPVSWTKHFAENTHGFQWESLYPSVMVEVYPNKDVSLGGGYIFLPEVKQWAEGLGGDVELVADSVPLPPRLPHHHQHALPIAHDHQAGDFLHIATFPSSLDPAFLN